VIEQAPGATIVTVLPATVQTDVVVEAKLTARPELAVAAIGNGPVPKPALLKDPKVMACDPWLMVKSWATGAAAA